MPSLQESGCLTSSHTLKAFCWLVLRIKPRSPLPWSRLNIENWAQMLPSLSQLLESFRISVGRSFLNSCALRLILNEPSWPLMKQILNSCVILLQPLVDIPLSVGIIQWRYTPRVIPCRSIDRAMSISREPSPEPMDSIQRLLNPLNLRAHHRWFFFVAILHKVLSHRPDWWDNGIVHIIWETPVGNRITYLLLSILLLSVSSVQIKQSRNSQISIVTSFLKLPSIDSRPALAGAWRLMNLNLNLIIWFHWWVTFLVLPFKHIQNLSWQIPLILIRSFPIWWRIRIIMKVTRIRISMIALSIYLLIIYQILHINRHRLPITPVVSSRLYNRLSGHLRIWIVISFRVWKPYNL